MAGSDRMNDKDNSNPIARLVRAATKIEPNELRATILSFLFAFSIMAAYFILRPVRDALSSDWTDEQLSWLWTSTFFFSALAVSLYGAVIPHVRLRVIVPGVYIFFSLTLVGFYIGGSTLGDNDLLNRAYYVWASVLGLFHLSVFWTFMSGLYNKEQAKRLFGIIALGATSGAIAGPAFVAAFAGKIGSLNMLLVSAALLLVPLPLIGQLDRLRATALGNADTQAELARDSKLGVNPFSGFARFVSNPYLLWIGAFIFLYVMMNTFLYYELRKVMGDLDRETRAQIWASIDLAVNMLAAFTALFATGRLTTRFGMPTTLALVPVIMAVGWALVAFNPVMLTVIFVQVVRRAGNYAITRPGREMLFTLVDDETRFKAKPVIDTVVYRGGDVATAWFYTSIVKIFGLGLAGVAGVGALFALLWATVGAYLGRRFESQSASQHHVQQAAADAARPE
jgi:AAA family ATP:ADP antiporter